jgi:transcriptional regulator with XRE-family HTH domain
MASTAREIAQKTAPSFRNTGKRSYESAQTRFRATDLRASGDDLAKLIGVDRSVAYRILKGERALTTDHIKTLCERFSVPADLFIR